MLLFKLEDDKKTKILPDTVIIKKFNENNNTHKNFLPKVSDEKSLKAIRNSFTNLMNNTKQVRKSKIMSTKDYTIEYNVNNALDSQTILSSKLR